MFTSKPTRMGVFVSPEARSNVPKIMIAVRGSMGAYTIKKYLEAKFATKKVWVIGPSEPYLVVMNGKYRRKILLKYKNIEDIKEEILQIISLSTKNKKVQVTVDVDPYTDY